MAAATMATQTAAPAAPAPSAAPPVWQMSTPQGAAPTVEPNPMATHVKVIAVLEIVWGSLAALATLALLVFFGIGSAATRQAGAPGFVSALVGTIGVFLAVFVGLLAALALVGGTRLLHLRRSGKVLTYVTAAISLLSVPFGTAFGIYAIIILSNPKTDQLLTNP
jgi:hypothetical protein